jgi:DNA-binding CsgD family transcriptional regulator
LVHGEKVLLLERSDELARLAWRIDEAKRGLGSACLVEGPAGTGKSSLLEAAKDLAGRAGFRVLLARAGPLDANLGWNLVRQLFAELVRAGADQGDRLLSGAAALAGPALGLTAGAEAGSVHGLYWVTAGLAEDAPVLLVVDDAHWGDGPSLQYLVHMAQRTGDLAVVIALASRSGQYSAGPLATLAADAGVERFELGDLGLSSCAELVRTALGPAASEGFCAACHSATGGNPFLLRELLAQLERNGAEPSDAEAAGVAAVTPSTVRRSVLLRLSQLSLDARGLAEGVAVLGGGVELALAGDLVKLDADRASAAADVLVRATVLTAGPRPDFVHPVVREVVYGELAGHRRARSHLRAARALAASGAGVDVVAAQLLESEPSADPWVVEQLRCAAGEASEAGAPSSAATLLERAVREPPALAERAEVLLELGRAEAAAGRPQASEHLRAAGVLAGDGVARARALLDLGRVLYISGHPVEGAGALDEGLCSLDDAVSSPLKAELQAAWLTVARTELSLRPRAVELAAAIAPDPPRGSSYGERALLAQVANELVFEGSSCAAAMELARLALGEGELIRLETSDGLAWLVAAGVLGWSDDLSGWDATVALALADAQRRGSVIGFATASYAYSFSRYYQGRLLDAIADAEQAIAAERDGWRMFLPAARAQLAWAMVERGELDAASSALDRAEHDAMWAMSSMQALVHEARARVHLGRARPREALEAALEAGRIFTQALVENPSLAPWRSRAAVAAAQLGKREQAEELIDEELRRARRFGAPKAIAVALGAASVARPERSIELLEEAIVVLENSPAVLERARALVLLGAALRRQGSNQAAIDMLRRGLDLSAACGASALERQARGELAVAGARPRRHRLSGLEALTAAERRIAQLAGQQLTNREIAQALFISLRTVETHLTSSYRKLGIGSRAGLRGALGADAPPTG